MGGSSPLTRGKPVRGPVRAWAWGLIPAHAGKTNEGACNTVHGRAHPRSRGENICPRCLTDQQEGSSPLTRGKPTCPSWTTTRAGLIPAHAGKTGASPSSATSGEGSSPLTRGKQACLSDTPYRSRLIPAHAGKTWRFGWRHPVGWAHPRSRGENRDDLRTRRELAGSSPLTRGKPTSAISS